MSADESVYEPPRETRKYDSTLEAYRAWLRSIARLEAQARAHYEIKCATDAEWKRHMDEVAPLVQTENTP